MQFKYLFKALCFDDSLPENEKFYTIEQTQDDASPTTPGRNCYYDVIQAEKAGNLRAFAIYEQTTGDEYLIDLSDCHFEVNQKSFKLHGAAELDNIRLIWFIKRELILDVVNTTVLNNQITSYNFGFQSNDRKTNENKQFIMTLN
jgi:hypothetical protein